MTTDVLDFPIHFFEMRSGYKKLDRGALGMFFAKNVILRKREAKTNQVPRNGLEIGKGNFKFENRARCHYAMMVQDHPAIIALLFQNRVHLIIFLSPHGKNVMRKNLQLGSITILEQILGSAILKIDAK